MTVHRKRALSRLRPVLAQAHRARGEVAVGEQWAQDVVRTIRREAAQHPAPSLRAWAEPLVWRVATGARSWPCHLCRVCGVYQAAPAPVAAAWLEEFDAGSPFP